MVRIIEVFTMVMYHVLTWLGITTFLMGLWGGFQLMAGHPIPEGQIAIVLLGSLCSTTLAFHFK